jgi:hypothetical protein
MVERILAYPLNEYANTYQYAQRIREYVSIRSTNTRIRINTLNEYANTRIRINTLNHLTLVERVLAFDTGL